MTLKITSSPNLDSNRLSGLGLVEERRVTDVLPLLLELHLQIVHLPLLGGQVSQVKSWVLHLLEHEVKSGGRRGNFSDKGENYRTQTWEISLIELACDYSNEKLQFTFQAMKR